MSCKDCGDCRYSDESTVTIRRTVTSHGFSRDCAPDKESVYSGLTYANPGVWSGTFQNGVVVTANSMCLGGQWTWSISGGGGGGGGGGSEFPPGCPEPAPVDTSIEVRRSDCGGFERVDTTTYLDDSWVAVTLEIIVENNEECL